MTSGAVLQGTGSEGHCAKTCQSRLDRRHTSGQDQPGGQRPQANAVASALPHLFNRNACHVREAPADTSCDLSHHHGERAIMLLIKARQTRLWSLPRQDRFSALSHPPPTPPAD